MSNRPGQALGRYPGHGPPPGPAATQCVAPGCRSQCKVQAWFSPTHSQVGSSVLHEGCMGAQINIIVL